jgi:alkanesulfonate monooxygenase SsuD/methylene tetrahydromethanopterin reductase-like flavin-dependent oxidoreductase (luciferase family)
VQVDVLLDTFGCRWHDLRNGAALAEQAGFDGVWLNDHLAGSIEGAPHVLECWTALSALAVSVPRLTVGSLVLNVANRDPGTLAVMAATLQHVSRGRLLLGLGAGAGAGTTYAAEQAALGRRLATGRERRAMVIRTVETLRRVWSGRVGPAAGFLRPEPVPPVVIAALGPKMAELAGRVGDGICVQVGSTMTELVTIARRAHAESGRDPARLLVTASLAAPSERTRPSVGMDVDRLIVFVAQPFQEGLSRLSDIVSRWSTDLLGHE